MVLFEYRTFLVFSSHLITGIKDTSTLCSIININHWKVLINYFHLKDRTLGFHPTYSKLKTTLQLFGIINSTTGKYCSLIDFHSQTQKIEPPCTACINSITEK